MEFNYRDFPFFILQFYQTFQIAGKRQSGLTLDCLLSFFENCHSDRSGGNSPKTKVPDTPIDLASQFVFGGTT